MSNIWIPICQYNVHIVEIRLNLRQISEHHLNWAKLYGNCTFEAKKMIAAQFIKAVHISRDYEIEVEFNVTFPEFQKTYEPLCRNGS